MKPDKRSRIFYNIVEERWKRRPLRKPTKNRSKFEPGPLWKSGAALDLTEI